MKSKSIWICTVWLWGGIKCPAGSECQEWYFELNVLYMVSVSIIWPWWETGDQKRRREEGQEAWLFCGFLFRMIKTFFTISTLTFYMSNPYILKANQWHLKERTRDWSWHFNSMNCENDECPWYLCYKGVVNLILFNFPEHTGHHIEVRLLHWKHTAKCALMFKTCEGCKIRNIHVAWPLYY